MVRGPLRHFAAAQQPRRLGHKADIGLTHLTYEDVD
jgi:hypothetical protein